MSLRNIRLENQFHQSLLQISAQASLLGIEGHLEQLRSWFNPRMATEPLHKGAAYYLIASLVRCLEDEEVSTQGLMIGLVADCLLQTTAFAELACQNLEGIVVDSRLDPHWPGKRHSSIKAALLRLATMSTWTRLQHLTVCPEGRLSLVGIELSAWSEARERMLNEHGRLEGWREVAQEKERRISAQTSLYHSAQTSRVYHCLLELNLHNHQSDGTADLVLTVESTFRGRGSGTKDLELSIRMPSGQGCSVTYMIRDLKGPVSLLEVARKDELNELLQGVLKHIEEPQKGIRSPSDPAIIWQHLLCRHRLRCERFRRAGCQLICHLVQLGERSATETGEASSDEDSLLSTEELDRTSQAVLEPPRPREEPLWTLKLLSNGEHHRDETGREVQQMHLRVQSLRRAPTSDPPPDKSRREAHLSYEPFALYNPYAPEETDMDLSFCSRTRLFADRQRMRALKNASGILGALSDKDAAVFVAQSCLQRPGFRAALLGLLSPDWSEANGLSHHEVLGQPNTFTPLPPVGNMAQPMGAPWRQQQQQPMGQALPGAPIQGNPGGPQMMPQQNFTTLSSLPEARANLGTSTADSRSMIKALDLQPISAPSADRMAQRRAGVAHWP